MAKLGVKDGTRDHPKVSLVDITASADADCPVKVNLRQLDNGALWELRLDKGEASLLAEMLVKFNKIRFP